MATCFQQLAILDASRTNLLARATTKTTINVFTEGFGGAGESIFGDGTHQIQSAAWSVVFVTSNYVRWT
jgi:hypothetical protein